MLPSVVAHAFDMPSCQQFEVTLVYIGTSGQPQLRCENFYLKKQNMNVFNSRRQRQVDLYVFKANPVYRWNSRTTKAIETLSQKTTTKIKLII